MKKPFQKYFSASLIILFLPPPRLLSTTATPSPQPPSMDERQIERDREQALMEALSLFDPSVLKEASSAQGRASPYDDSSIAMAVERLRRVRKAQFKHLTWTHIKKMVTTGSVLEKAKFLDERDKHLA